MKAKNMKRCKNLSDLLKIRYMLVLENSRSILKKCVLFVARNDFIPSLGPVP